MAPAMMQAHTQMVKLHIILSDTYLEHLCWAFD